MLISSPRQQSAWVASSFLRRLDQRERLVCRGRCQTLSHCRSTADTHTNTRKHNYMPTDKQVDTEKYFTACTSRNVTYVHLISHFHSSSTTCNSCRATRKKLKNKVRTWLWMRSQGHLICGKSNCLFSQLPGYLRWKQESTLKWCLTDWLTDL